MAKIALATKYRPKTFSDVVEQDSTKVILQQQLESGEFKNSYLFVGGAGTGKTTCARIFANEINNHEGHPIELDAASHSSVDDVRELIHQAKTQSLESEYKIFIIDECVTGDVEVLTSTGFKRFDDCDGTETVAQYNNGKIEFVASNHVEWVKNEYHGDLIKWSPRNWCSVRMTPNHVQPLFYNKSQKIKEKYIKDIKFAQSNNLIVSGKGIGSVNDLTPLDRLAIVCQADATIQRINKNYAHWSISLVKQRKIDRLLQIFEDGNIEYNEIKTSSGKRRFTFDTPLDISKYFNTHFSLDFGYQGAREFIDEVTFWDGYKTDKYVEYMSTEKVNTDFVSAVAVLGGYSARQHIRKDDRNVRYKDVHTVMLYDKELSSCQHISKTVEYIKHDGYVYCVKVPSHQIVIRSQGFVFVTGNCHSLSNTAWQAFLKLIEEPPTKSIFIFCTTNPEKIPKTILSRVQRYDFKRISNNGIRNRLIDIYTKEGFKGSGFGESFEYLAKLADGGMRDAITLMDKCLSYSEELTIENIVKALGVADYDTMMDLVSNIIQNDAERVIRTIEEIHSDGKDLKQFIKQFLNFVLDIKKYAILDSFDYIQIPYSSGMEQFLDTMADEFDKISDLLDLLIKINAEIKYDSSPKYMIEACILNSIDKNI